MLVRLQPPWVEPLAPNGRSEEWKFGISEFRNHGFQVPIIQDSLNPDSYGVRVACLVIYPRLTGIINPDYKSGFTNVTPSAVRGVGVSINSHGRNL
jgi:hypothetical protein